ncbi:MAG: type II toxin-antitoxin system death-on-curing family toxin [Opitutales bacterium]|jgi:death-on-curing protein
MTEPNWVTKEECLALHAMLVARFGGAVGMRDESALETSLNRPLQHFSYSNPAPSIIELATVYCSGIVKSHPFLDGNKRTGFVAAALFLESNGYQLTASEEEAAIQILALADSRLSDQELTSWLEANCSERS